MDEKFSCLSWTDDNDFNHVMRGYPSELAPHVENLKELGYTYEVAEFNE